jgi:hypothetical protein
MIRTLRALFLRCQLREKLLLLAFALMGVLLWLSGFSSRGGKFWREQRSTTGELKTQAGWLAQRDSIEAAAQKAAALLDDTKTLNATRLSTTVQQLASDAGLRGYVGQATVTKTSGRTSINTLDCTISRIGRSDWLALNKFYEALQARAPYIGIEKFSLVVNGEQHTLALTVSSIEVVH